MKKLSILSAILSIALISCEKTTTNTDPKPAPKTDPEASPDYKANKYLRKEYMDVYYYWVNEVKEANSKLDLSKYTIYDAFDAMLYKDDRWSWMESGESYISTESGEVKGSWGVSFVQRDDCKEAGDYNVYVRFVYPESPLVRHGVTRGAKLTGINGFVMPEHGFESNEQVDYFNEHIQDSPQTFTFTLTDGESVTFEETLPRSVSTNFIFSEQVFDADDFDGLTEPVGYFNLLSFKAGFIDDIDKAFAKFKKAGVKKMIVDLRYNGGGDSNASQRLISYLAPAGLEGKPYVTRSHNSLLAPALDMTEYIGLFENNKYSDMAIGLDEIFFIMDHSSASASEMVFNGLRPYLKDKLHLVGRQTYGKPNGMYVLFYPADDEAYKYYNAGNYSKLEWVFYPICFFNVNSEGESIPYGQTTASGFVPDNERPDDILHDFGVEEDRVKACLTYIVTGSYPALPVTKSTNSVSNGIENKAFAPEWKTNPHYGTDLVNRHSLPETF